MKQSHVGKAAARQAVWDRLQREGLARFPFPPHGRIPNFDGAREAAVRLFQIEPWATARRLKVNPDAPQRYVREARSTNACCAGVSGQAALVAA